MGAKMGSRFKKPQLPPSEFPQDRLDHLLYDGLYEEHDWYLDNGWLPVDPQQNYQATRPRQRKRQPIIPVDDPVDDPIEQDGRLTFIEVFLALIVGWILVSLWERAIKNFAYRTLGLERDSTLHAIVLASAVTLVFLVFTFSETDITAVIERNLVTGGDLL